MKRIDGSTASNDIGILMVQYGKLEEVLETLEEFPIAPPSFPFPEHPDPDLFHAYPLVNAAMKFIRQAISSRKEELRQNTE